MVRQLASYSEMVLNGLIIVHSLFTKLMFAAGLTELITVLTLICLVDMKKSPHFLGIVRGT